jgi:hypothetical protein
MLPFIDTYSAIIFTILATLHNITREGYGCLLDFSVNLSANQYEHYATEDHPTLTLLNFIQAVIMWLEARIA